MLRSLQFNEGFLLQIDVVVDLDESNTRCNGRLDVASDDSTLFGVGAFGNTDVVEGVGNRSQNFHDCFLKRGSSMQHCMTIHPVTKMYKQG